mmetsp:Transcript_42743/g.103118  ORF Transcript_42743/g.103118 Transcript_42743/m.103118 type:complete len:101 (-) Transcript_42743:2636-2938(-)
MTMRMRTTMASTSTTNKAWMKDFFVKISLAVFFGRNRNLERKEGRRECDETRVGRKMRGSYGWNGVRVDRTWQAALQNVAAVLRTPSPPTHGTHFHLHSP